MENRMGTEERAYIEETVAKYAPDVDNVELPTLIVATGVDNNKINAITANKTLPNPTYFKNFFINNPPVYRIA